MGVFLLVSSAIFQPLQCDVRSHGERTQRAYQQVVRWNSEFGDEHQRMVIVGLVVSLVPLAFVSMSL